MRALVLCFVLGCGSSSPAPQAPATSAGSSAPVAAGSASSADIDAMIVKMADFKQQTCDCPDETCLDKVQDAMGAWGQELKAKGLANAALNEEQTKRVSALTDAMNKCAKRASNMSD